MKTLIESLLDDEDILMGGSDEGIEKISAQKYFDTNRLMADEDGHGKYDIYRLNSMEVKLPIPDYIKVNTITWCDLDNTDSLDKNKWNVFPGGCDKIEHLRIIYNSFTENKLKDFDKLNVKNIFNLKFESNPTTKYNNFFKTLKLPKSNITVVDISTYMNLDKFDGKEFENVDIQNLKNIRCKFLTIDDRFTHIGDWSDNIDYTYGFGIKKDPDTIKKIDDIFKNNDIESLIIYMVDPKNKYSMNNRKQYEVLKASKGYKLKVCKLKLN